ncbi:antibiotic biosynthesis monooxygenase family protein [Peribacillus kribbensis]|uniref:antibiotic biosynthesis monooxygenase family protein n=1 Tax=Peribacillus kribbensis TaxID=356658 RepID=UPI0003FEF4A7|nr:antibiotic biosynthesis monooxygenase [Peribacillus kribbensis]
MGLFADTPEPPYYAVIFTSKRTEGDKGYGGMSEKLAELVQGEDGFLGMESVRDETGAGITVSYWKSLDAINEWRNHSVHKAAKKRGREEWYEGFALRITRVEKDTRSF